MMRLANSAEFLDEKTRRAVHLRKLPPPAPTSSSSSNPVSAAPVTPLPPEVLLQIVQSIDDSYYDPDSKTWVDSEGGRRRDLCALALTSRTFLAAVRVALYREITIIVKGPIVQTQPRNRGFMDGIVHPSPIDDRRLSPAGLFVAGRLELECTLACSPHLANLVQSVVLLLFDPFHRLQAPDEPKISEQSLRSVCRACRNVSRLRFQTYKWEIPPGYVYAAVHQSSEILSTISALPPGLTSLALAGLSTDADRTDTVFKILCAHPGLKNIQLGPQLQWDDFYLALGMDQIPAFELESLSFALSTSTTLAFGQALLHHSTASLRHFELYYPEYPIESLELERFTYLKSLTVAPTDFTNTQRDDNPAVIAYLQRVIKDLPRLRHLTVRHVHTRERTSLLDNFEYLPPSLETLATKAWRSSRRSYAS